jgi:hypothetical protein
MRQTGEEMRQNLAERLCYGSAPRGGEVEAGAPTHHHPAGDDIGRSD